MILIVHDDDEDGAYGMCLGAAGGPIHSVWQCARSDCENRFMHIERCSRRSWWRRLLGIGDRACLRAADVDAHADVHGESALAKLAAHWETEHPGVSWQTGRAGELRH